MNAVELIDIKTIEGKDVTFLRIHNHVCAYVRVDIPLDTEEMPSITLNEKTFVGIDTAHAWNLKQSFDEKFKDAEYQISEVIKFAKSRGYVS